MVVNNITIRGIPMNISNRVEEKPVEEGNVNLMLGENNPLPTVSPVQRSFDVNLYAGTSPNKKFKELVQMKKPYAMYYAGSVGFKNSNICSPYNT